MKEEIKVSPMQNAVQFSISSRVFSETSKKYLCQSHLLTNAFAPSKFTIQPQKERRKKSSSHRKKAVLWDRFEQLYYFDAVLQFVIQNPYLTVSWAQWKPIQYYNFIAEKIALVFGERARKPNQLKTKDQNLKKQYFIKSDNKRDLVDLALQKVTYFVEKMKKISQNEAKINEKVKKLLLRCEETLKSYNQLVSQMRKPKKYEIQLIELVHFLELQQRQMTNHQRIDEVAEEDKDALSDKNMNNEIFEVIFPTQI